MEAIAPVGAAIVCVVVAADLAFFLLSINPVDRKERVRIIDFFNYFRRINFVQAVKGDQKVWFRLQRLKNIHIIGECDRFFKVAT